MIVPRRLRSAAAPLLTSLLAASIIFAQQPRAAQPAAQQKSAVPPAQTKTNAPAPPRPASPPRANTDIENVTLDTLFGADSYAVYGEMRSVGQYVSSEEFKQVMTPLRLPGSVPSQVSDLIDFFSAHAESLSAARFAFAAMPVADGLPNVVAAVELPSAEDAQKFEPQMRRFMASYYAAHPEIAGDADASGGGATRTGARAATLGTAPRTSEGARAGEGAATRASEARRAAAQQQQTRQQNGQNAQAVRAGEKVSVESSSPFVVKRAGAVLALADKQFTFRRLRGAESSLALVNEPGFAAARARLAADTLFLYFNTTRTSRYTKRQREEVERRMKEYEAEQARSNANNNRAASQDGTTSKFTTATVAADPVLIPPDPQSNSNSGANISSTVVMSGGNVAVLGSSPNEKLTPEQQAEREAMVAETRAAIAREEEAERQRKSQPGYEQEQRRQEFESELGQAIFSGDVAEGAWAESIGVGASLEGDQLVVRALFYSESETTPTRPIPFVPILISGPQVAPEAASVAPADSDIFISTSLDVPQMYDYVASAFKIFDMAAGESGSPDRLGLFDNQIGSFEQQAKFRIKEDLINSLGNEIAVVLPGGYLGVRRAPAKQKKPSANATTDGAASDAQAQDAPAGTSAPVVFISLRDKKTVEEIVPRALEAAGLKGVSEGQLFVKRGDADVLAFGSGSVAFLGNFLVVSFDPRAMDWIVDSYNRGETLANSEEFRRAAGWQQRQLLGQAYVSNALLKDAFGDAHASVDDIEDAQLRAFVTQLDPNPGAITYALTRDGASLFHELHVPKNLLSLMSASALVSQQTAQMRNNESAAQSMLYTLYGREAEFKTKNNRYGTQAELDDVTRSRRGPGYPPMKVEGYDIRFTVSADKFEATATPTGYPKQGRRSFYLDQTGVLRGGDLGGKPATSESDPVNY